ncbi:hypothetical protein GKQ77_15535 [Streptomyces sp. BG9H]|uniref:DUF6895 domain-containing protein n=1 Tax=Streptomyces anatolicus TaxID=2675858 RepID=A0ABS6YNF9_9ACTN|nr:hypothetical protein [Streptomyces anatolicus]MBW5422960.1 hypothetical protein [Streptomyces anatolicus]
MTDELPVGTDVVGRVTGRALGWLHRNRPYGAFPAPETADVADPDGYYKSLGETALAASLLLREGSVPPPGHEQAARELLDFAWAQLRQGDLLYERQLRHPLMADPLELYAHFTRGGHRHERLDALLVHLSGLRTHQGAELVPNRRLAVANAARIAGFAGPGGFAGGADWSGLLAATWLGRLPEPWAIDWMTAYCMTHTVFHVTDWGGLPHALPGDVVAYLECWLPVWIDIWSEIEEWDLVVELLIVDACLPRPGHHLDVWERLAAVQHADGLVPRDGKPVDDEPEQAFRDHQHTAVVTVVAGTLAQARSGDASPR